MKENKVNTSRVPVYRDAGFELYDAETTRNTFLKETMHEREPDLYIYSRYRNPTVIAAEEEIMKLEECNWALLTESGMSAIDTAVSVFQHGSSTRPWLFFSEIYGGTISFIESVLKGRRGLDIHTFNPESEKYDIPGFEKIVSTLKPELVYIEAISNPLLVVPDVVPVIEIAHKHGAKVMVDNTFATSALWKPLKSGADIVIYSATKYLSGHGDLTAGVICGNDQDIMRSAIEYRKYTGHMLSPDDAYRLSSQVQTFGLRFSQICANASQVSAILNEAETINKIWFPGLPDHPTHKEAEKLFEGRGFGGMITFDFRGKDESEKRSRRDIFIKAVAGKIRLVPSLGDPKSLLMPVESVWGVKYPHPGMIRLSAGFENTAELESTIREGLKAVR